MNYAQIRPYDISNGEGIRVSIFVTGCKFNCPGCFNKEYQNFNFGKKWTDDETNEVINLLNRNEIEGLTILGGEPLEHCKDLSSIIKTIKEKTNKSIWIYSGYTLDEIRNDDDRLNTVLLCDTVVEGRFVENLKNPNLRFRGSSNQNIYDVVNGDFIKKEI